MKITKIINGMIVSALLLVILKGNLNFNASAAANKPQKAKQVNSLTVKKTKTEKGKLGKKKLSFKKKNFPKETNEIIMKLEKQLSDLEKRLNELEDKYQNVHKKVEKKDKKKVDGEWVWPVPGYHYITSGFNDGEGRSHTHGAIDIGGSGIYGATVVAANSGIVTQICTDDRGGGYGNYIVIDHDNGKSTLYAHLSSVSVSKGQKVSAGQKVGNVGNTGFSTGPHLHFEYRVDGVRANPAEILDC